MTIKRLVTYRKLGPTELILPTDLHSVDEGKTLYLLLRSKTVGQSPEKFPKDRSFWRITSNEIV